MIKSAVVALVALAALTACHGNRTGNAAATQTAPSANGASAQVTPPDCQGETAVWVIQGPKVYLLPGDRHYGKTKRGRYMCLQQAEADGYRAARHPFRHHHRQKLFSV